MGDDHHNLFNTPKHAILGTGFEEPGFIRQILQQHFAFRFWGITQLREFPGCEGWISIKKTDPGLVVSHFGGLWTDFQ